MSLLPSLNGKDVFNPTFTSVKADFSSSSFTLFHMMAVQVTLHVEGSKVEWCECLTVEWNFTVINN